MNVDKATWSAALRSAAQDHLKDTARFQATLVDRQPADLPRVFAALPLSRCDLIVSYWGDLERALPALSPSVRSRLEFAVTAPAGPKRIAVLWGHGKALEGRLFDRERHTGPWQGSRLRWEVKRAD